MNFMRGGRPGLASAAILEYWAVEYGVLYGWAWDRAGYTAVNKKKKIAYNQRRTTPQPTASPSRVRLLSTQNRARRPKYISAHTHTPFACAPCHPRHRSLSTLRDAVELNLRGIKTRESVSART